LIGISVNYLFGDKIEEVILKNINSKLKNEIINTDIEFSILSKFPYASITISDLLIHDSHTNKDTLLYSKLSVIKLNVIDVFSGDYTIKNIEIQDANLNILFNKNGLSNFEILSDTVSNNSEINFDKIKLNNFNLKYEDKYKNHLISANISSELNYFEQNLTKNISINGNLYTKHVIISDDNYINNKNIVINSDIEASKNDWKINASKLEIETIIFNNLLFNKDAENWDLQTKSTGEISEIIKNTPEKFQYLFNDHELSGIISADIQIQEKKRFKNPYCNIDFEIKDANYKSKTQPFFLSDINTKANFNNGAFRNFSSSVFKFENFESRKQKGVIKGEFTLSNLNKYFLNANLFSSWKLQELNDFIIEPPIKNLKGEVFGNLYYNGNISFDEKFPKYFALSKHIANLNFKNVSFNYQNSPLNFSSEEMNWKIENHNIFLDNENLYINNTDLNFEGEVQDLLLYLLNQKDKILINGDVTSEIMNFKDVIAISEIEGDEEEVFTSVLPKWIDTKIELNVDSFYYDKFIAKKLSGKVEYNSNNLKLKSEKLVMNTLDGEIKADFQYYENKLHDLVLKSNLNLYKIDISKGFNSFNNFNQKYITDKNIKGTATSNMYIQAMWDKNYKFYSSSLNVNTQLKIEEGELIEFEPMYNLSDYVNLEELQNVKFATLENKIRIENKKIIIPEMDINSSALSVHVSGRLSFDNIMDFKVRLLLSDLLSKKSRKKSNINIENFSIDESGKTTIQMRMKGPIDDPKISLDKVKIRKDVFNEIRKEKNKVKEIFEEKILEKTNDSELEDNKKSEFEIEWDDEN
tara:strand:+ start:4508 stop:6937 length:2430 start_codon:yes stop_codon:yes gene_type:complete